MTKRQFTIGSYERNARQRHQRAMQPEIALYRVKTNPEH
jgi:hypothetical protein